MEPRLQAVLRAILNDAPSNPDNIASINWTVLSAEFETKVAIGSVVVTALCYKPEGRGFNTRWDDFLNISQPYRTQKSLTGIVLLYGDGVCFLWGTYWTESTATSSQYLAINCEPIV
jgi:hypothetical protein